MTLSAARRTLLKTIAAGLASAGLGSSGRAATGRGLTDPGADALRALMANLAAAPRRRDFKSVPMILTAPDQWDAAALDMVLGATSKSKQVWNNTDIAGYWLPVMRNALNTQIWGFRHPDFLAVSATHGTAGLALLDQATWDKYQIGKMLAEKHGDRFKTNSLIVDTSADTKQGDTRVEGLANFENPTGLFAMGAGDSIPILQKRGVVFMACHNALWGYAESFIKHGQNPDKLSHEALAAELTNHLIPGTVLTPGIVGTLPELQKAGFFYASI